MATEKEIIEIINRYNAGQATLQDIAFLEHWYMQHKHADQMEYDADELLEDTSAIWNNLEKQYQRTRLIALWKKISVAAAAVAVMTLGVWLYYTPSSRQSTATRDLSANDIAPGRNTATLTLASGKVFNLDTNKTSVVVTDSVKTFVMLTASTPRGGTYQVTLPDGTEVWLNADSKITFPSQFTSAKRQISLEGEAYFQVLKDKAHPFIVESKGQQVEVLGTHFNINAYPDESATKTTLLEGSVSVSPVLTSTARAEFSSVSPRQRAATILKPNQQAINNGGISIKDVQADNAVAWMQGKFVFERETLESILRKISRWYDVQIVNQGADLKATYSANISRGERVSQILSLLEKTNTVRFEIRGRQIIVNKYQQSSKQ